MTVKDFIQDIAGEGITAFLRRGKSERIANIDKPKGGHIHDSGSNPPD